MRLRSSTACVLVVVSAAIALAVWMLPSFSRTIISYPKIIDLGEVDRADLIEFDLPLENRSKTPCVVGQFSLGCGCLTLVPPANASSDDRNFNVEVPGGGSVRLVGRAQFVGAETRQVDYPATFSDITNNQQHRFHVRARIRESIVAYPNHLVIESGKSSDEVSLLLVDKRPIERRGHFDVFPNSADVVVRKPVLTDERPQLANLAPTDDVYEVKVRPSANARSVRTALTVSDQRSSSVILSVPVIVEANVEIRITPERLVFVDGVPNQCVQLSVSGSLKAIMLRSAPDWLRVETTSNTSAKVWLLHDVIRGGGDQSIVIDCHGQDAFEPVTIPVQVIMR